MMLVTYKYPLLELHFSNLYILHYMHPTYTYRSSTAHFMQYCTGFTALTVNATHSLLTWFNFEVLLEEDNKAVLLIKAVSN